MKDYPIIVSDKIKISLEQEEVQEVHIVPSVLYLVLLSRIYPGLGSLFSEPYNLINFRIKWTKTQISISGDGVSIGGDYVVYVVLSNHGYQSCLIVDIDEHTANVIKEILKLPENVYPQHLVLKKFKNGWKAFILLFPLF